jgi:CRP-like cAMP-binding protein
MAGKYLDERTYEPGEIIFTEGDPAAEMFIIQEGKVVITKQVAGSEVFLATLERGDFFGEMALLDSQPRHATCAAVERTRLVAIKSGELLMKLRRDPTFALEMVQTMSRRIRRLNERLGLLMRSEAEAAHELERLRGQAEFSGQRTDR